jgi:4-amino-4-deoxy-L-arabinose transferase-like glycosyltransferase
VRNHVGSRFIWAPSMEAELPGPPTNQGTGCITDNYEKAMKIKKEYILLACILLVGIIVRIIKFADPAIVMDTVAFSRLGKNLIESGRYVFGENYNMGVFFPPGYPVFVGIVNAFANDLFFSAKLVSFIASCITIVLSYFIGRDLYNREAGLFAALVYAVYPVLLIISVDAYADALFFCFLLLSIYIFIVSLKKNNFYVFTLLGISIAAAFLTRPEGMFLLLLPGLQLFGIFNKRMKFNAKYIFKLALVFSIFALIISPYMIFLKTNTGKLSISGKANVSMILGELSSDREYHDVVNAPDNLYDRAAFTLNEDKTQLKGWNRKANFSLKEYIFKDPVALLKKYQKNVMREISTLIKLLIPILLPLFFSFFNRDLFKSRQRLIFIMYPCLFFLMYPLFIIIEKQTLSIVLYLIFFSAGGFSNSPQVISDIVKYYGINKGKAVNLLEYAIKPIMVALLILASLSYLKYSSFDKVPMPVEHVRAGTYLKEHVTPEYEKMNVMARKPYVNFYSGAKFTMIPYAHVADVVNFAKLYNVDYIVIDERALSKWDSYNELLDMHRYSDDVELFYEDTAGVLIRLFKVKK